jgi:hypothetical protein
MLLREIFGPVAKRVMNEGGNLELPGGHAAQTIDLKVHDRKFMVPVLKKLMAAINTGYAETFKQPLWAPALLQSGKFLSGSSLHFLNTNIPDAEFVKKKPKVGDIDTQVDKEKEANLEQWLNGMKGKHVGNATFLGFQRGNEQFSSLWELSNPPVKVQIDLEFVKFEKDEPTDWAQFSHSSSWDDIQEGIKGVFHKYIIQAFATLTRQDFLLRKMVGRGKAKEEQDVPTTDNMVSFAVSSKEGGGLRQKYEPVLDDNNKPLIKDGLPVLRARPTEGYDQTIAGIFGSLFHKKINPQNYDSVSSKLWSFVGLLEVMNMFLDQSEKDRVVEAFMIKLFGRGAQGLYKNDPDRDIDEKNTALAKMFSSLKIQPPAELNQMIADYKSTYKMTESINEAEAPDYRRQGIKHIYNPGSSTEMKDAEFLTMVDELAKNGSKLDGIPINLKADGAGIRFGKDEQGRPFFMTSRVTKPLYVGNVGDFAAYGQSQGQDSEQLERTKKYDQALDIIVNSDFIKTLPTDTIVQAEMMFNEMAEKTKDGLKFVNIGYDPKKLGSVMTLVPFSFKKYSTGESLPDAEKIKKGLISKSNGKIKMVDNQLKQKGIDVSKIIAPVLNMDSSLKAALTARTRGENPQKDQAKAILTKARQDLSDFIINNPNISGKDQLGSNIEGLVINLPNGQLAKVTSQQMKDKMAAKKAAPAPKEGETKTAVVAIGSFIGHKGHEELFNYTIKKAKELGGEPYLFIGNAEGKDDPIPPAVKVQTWHKLYPQYAKNISTVTQEGGSLIQKIKHELINPMPGKPPKYDNIVIMVGEDRANMNMPAVLMKAVNKFQGYEHVKVSLGVTPRGTGISGTMLRNTIKNDPPERALAVWSNAFDVKKLGEAWIKHLIDITKKGMGIATDVPQKEDAAGVGIVDKQNSTADVGPGTLKKNLKAFDL